MSGDNNTFKQPDCGTYAETNATPRTVAQEGERGCARPRGKSYLRHFSRSCVCAIFGERQDSTPVCRGALLPSALTSGDANTPGDDACACATHIVSARLFPGRPSLYPALLSLFDKTEITRQRRVSSHYSAVVSEQKDAGSCPAISDPLC